LWSLSCLLAFLLLTAVWLFPAIPATADDADLYEIGTMSQDHYGQAMDPNKCCCLLYGKDKAKKKTYSDATWSAFCTRFVSRMHELSAGYHEVAPFPIREASAHASQIESTGQNLGDAVDVFVWSGHSYITGTPCCDPNDLEHYSTGPGPSTERDFGAALHFIADHTGSPSHPPSTCCYYLDNVNVNHVETRLGANDCEVAVFLTCEFLKNRGYQPLRDSIRYMMQGTHMILGFATEAYFHASAQETQFGGMFAEKLMGIPNSQEPRHVIPAWEEACEWDQPADVCVRAVYWNGDCMSDYLLGNWRGYGMGGPPPACTPGTLNQFNETTYWTL
jgi:hypothetical protein